MFFASMIALFGLMNTVGAGIQENAVEIAADDFSCLIGNNEAWGEVHRAGYNGILQIKMPGLADTPFVPMYAGLNLEHYFDLGPRNPDSNIFFEPRRMPMDTRVINATTVELYQEATPHYGVESWTRFEVSKPGQIEMTFRCIPHKDGLEGKMLGVFWASYINAPLDKSMYFLEAGSTLDAPVWVQYCTQKHDRDSTVLSEGDEREFAFDKSEDTLYNNISPLRYSEPFFYGRYGDHVLIYIFEPATQIRFSHSPSGGGKTAAGDGHNPAWDFQYLVDHYEVNHEYGYRMRFVCKTWKDRADVIEEVRAFLDTGDNIIEN